MNDRPTAIEFLQAARQCLESELIPSLSDPRLRFQTLIAANVLAIVERELGSQEQHATAEWDSLAQELTREPFASQRLPELRQALRTATAQLCSRIREGAFDAEPEFRKLCGRLRPIVIRKLEVANPRYLASSKE